MSMYLITGGAGFIGSHLVDHLLAEGVPAKKLRLIVLPGESLSNLPANQPLEIIRGDIRNQKLINRAMKGVSVVYHLAARIDFDGQSLADYQDVNIDATKYLLDAAVAEKVKKFIFFSSIAVHGLPADRGDIINYSETSPIDPSNLYGQSKWLGEELVRQAHASHSLPYAIIRPASVYGPREKGPTLALYRAIQRHQFMMIGDGLNKLHYVYVTDLVAAARLAELSRRKAGEYIIAGPEPTQFTELAKAVAASIDETVPSWHLPTWFALAVAYVFGAIKFLTKINLPLFPSRVRTMTSSYYYDITKAKTELGYRPQVPFKRGAQLTGHWYLEHQLL
jgi:dihydroflavonol-4-reductase